MKKSISILLTGLASGVLCAAGALWMEERLGGGRREEIRQLCRCVELVRRGCRHMEARDEEVMMLRHDMASHLRILREKAGTDAPQVTAYLDELMAQNQNIRPVVRSGNEMLDLLLNGKLADAIQTGIHMDICCADMPGRLPLTDAELSSLIINILDNAVQAAAQTAEGSVRLDIHCKNDFFVLACENSATNRGNRSRRKESLPAHGWGRKIVEQIVERHGGIIKVKQGENRYRLILAIPMTAAR